jgi:hypothetical protein
MVGFANVLRPVSFTGMHFKRWKLKAMLWLTTMNVFWVSDGKSKGFYLLKRRKNIQKQHKLLWAL